MAKFEINGWDDEAERQELMRIIESTENLTVEVKVTKSTRTSRQNAALHQGFKQIAEACAKKGITKDMLFKNIGRDTNFPVTAEDAKEVLRAVCEVIYNERSTTAIPSGEVKDVWAALEVAYSTRLKVDIGDYPCQESLMRDQTGY